MSTDRFDALAAYHNQVTRGVPGPVEQAAANEARAKQREASESVERVKGLNVIADALMDNATFLRTLDWGMSGLIFDLVGVGPETGNTDRVALTLARQHRELRDFRPALEAFLPVLKGRFARLVSPNVPTERLRAQNERESRLVAEHVIGRLVDQMQNEEVVITEQLVRNPAELQALQILQKMIPERVNREPSARFDEVAEAAGGLFFNHSIASSVRIFNEYLNDNPQGPLTGELRDILPRLMELPQHYAVVALKKARSIGGNFELLEGEIDEFKTMSTFDRLKLQENHFARLYQIALASKSSIMGWYPAFQNVLEHLHAAMASGEGFLSMREEDLAPNRKEREIDTAVKRYARFVHDPNPKISSPRAVYAEMSRSCRQAQATLTNPDYDGYRDAWKLIRQGYEYQLANQREALVEATKELFGDEYHNDDAATIDRLLDEIDRLGVSPDELDERMRRDIPVAEVIFS